MIFHASDGMLGCSAPTNMTEIDLRAICYNLHAQYFPMPSPDWQRFLDAYRLPTGNFNCSDAAIDRVVNVINILASPTALKV